MKLKTAQQNTVRIKTNNVKKMVFMLLITGVVFSSYAQDSMKTFYKISKVGKVLNEEEFQKMKDDLISKLAAISSDILVKEILTDSIVKNDSIIKTYRFDIKAGRAIKVETVENVEVPDFLNKKLPSQTLQTIDGKEINLNEYIGKPLVLNFWFTTCKPCIEEMPVLNKLKKRYENKVNFISITFEKKETVEKFFKSHEFTYLPVVNAREFIDKLGIKSFPRNIIIDKNGIVRIVEGGIPYISERGKMKIGNGEVLEENIKKFL